MSKYNIRELMNVKSIYSLNLDECEFLLNYYKNRDDSYNFENKIKQLKRSIEKLKSHPKKEQWILDAEEYVKITNLWVANGAKHRNIHEGYFTIWEYEGVEFYRWSKSDTIKEMLERAKTVDVKLTFR